ncbi:uncharacterized protein LOC134244120 isoform X2 [Saccostrea cucullata]|uniref:uncharacterized protein LOC134244120 isoform X2 n=1 Tax=Saccostrea cuccullata TaxID=36930 RepID=UPI002ED61367
MKAFARYTFFGLFPKLVSGVFMLSISLNFGCILPHQINGLEGSLRIKRGSADRVSCMSSLPTIMIGRKCPKDESTFEERKQVLNCSYIPQNCTDPLKFQYHCVLNEYANRSVEVCAIPTRILGSVCAEFNIGGKFVQEHYTTPVPCSRCPFVYTSTDAYKYQECYRGIQNISSTTTVLSTYSVLISSTHPTGLQSTSSNIPELNVLYFVDFCSCWCDSNRTGHSHFYKIYMAST